MHPKITELNNKRLKLNLSIACIERELKINRETLRKLFNGTHEPKIGLFFKVEEYLKNKVVTKN
jgi:predicted transcriptional regulator